MTCTQSSAKLRQEVIKEAEKWMGTPFVHDACVKGSGVACGPLLIAVYGALGIPVPELSTLQYYSEDWHKHTKEEKYLNDLAPFTRVVETPEMADIALFSFGRFASVYCHSAIVVEWPRVIHTMWRRSVEHSDASQPPLHRLHGKVLFLSPFNQ